MAKNEKTVDEVNGNEQGAVSSGKTKKKKEKKAKKHAWKGFKSELGKIVWPTWKQVLKNSGIVVVIVLICAIAIGALDLAFNTGFRELVNLFNK